MLLTSILVKSQCNSILPWGIVCRKPAYVKYTMLAHAHTRPCPHLPMPTLAHAHTRPCPPSPMPTPAHLTHLAHAHLTHLPLPLSHTRPPHLTLTHLTFTLTLTLTHHLLAH